MNRVLSARAVAAFAVASQNATAFTGRKLGLSENFEDIAKFSDNWTKKGQSAAGAPAGGQYVGGTGVAAWIHNTPLELNPTTKEVEVTCKFVTGGSADRIGVCARGNDPAGDEDCFVFYRASANFQAYRIFRFDINGTAVNQIALESVNGDPITFPIWIKIRVEDTAPNEATITGYDSPDGVNWTQRIQHVATGADYLGGDYVGFADFARGDDVALDDWAAIDIKAPINTVAPALSGTPIEREFFTTTDGTWTDPQAFTYQWQHATPGSEGSPTNLAGETDFTLHITDDASLVGERIRCVVTSGGKVSAETAWSAAVTAYTEPNLSTWTGYAKTTALRQPLQDLTDQVIFFDLANLPQSWWDNVRADGGDIRVAEDDSPGVTASIPIDLISFDKTNKKGLLAFLHPGTISSSSAPGQIRIYAGQPNAGLPHRTNAIGQYATYPSSWWAFYPEGFGKDWSTNQRHLTHQTTPKVVSTYMPSINGCTYGANAVNASDVMTLSPTVTPPFTFQWLSRRNEFDGDFSDRGNGNNVIGLCDVAAFFVSGLNPQPRTAATSGEPDIATVARLIKPEFIESHGITAWSSATAYSKWELADDSGTVYEALQAVGPSATAPSSDPANWRVRVSPQNGSSDAFKPNSEFEDNEWIHAAAIDLTHFAEGASPPTWNGNDPDWQQRGHAGDSPLGGQADPDTKPYYETFDEFRVGEAGLNSGVDVAMLRIRMEYTHGARNAYDAWMFSSLVYDYASATGPDYYDSQPFALASRPAVTGDQQYFTGGWTWVEP